MKKIRRFFTYGIIILSSFLFYDIGFIFSKWFIFIMNFFVISHVLLTGIIFTDSICFVDKRRYQVKKIKVIAVIVFNLLVCGFALAFAFHLIFLKLPDKILDSKLMFSTLIIGFIWNYVVTRIIISLKVKKFIKKNYSS